MRMNIKQANSIPVGQFRRVASSGWSLSKWSLASLAHRPQQHYFIIDTNSICVGRAFVTIYYGMKFLSKWHVSPRYRPAISSAVPPKNHFEGIAFHLHFSTGLMLKVDATSRSHRSRWCHELRTRPNERENNGSGMFRSALFKFNHVANTCNFCRSGG